MQVPLVRGTLERRHYSTTKRAALLLAPLQPAFYAQLSESLTTEWSGWMERWLAALDGGLDLDAARTSGDTAAADDHHVAQLNAA